MSKKCDNCLYKINTDKIFVNECDIEDNNQKHFSLDYVCDKWKPFNGLINNKVCKKCGALAVVDTDYRGLYIVKCSNSLCDNETSGTTYSHEAIQKWDKEN
jgi:hypothetical protein